VSRVHFIEKKVNYNDGHQNLDIFGNQILNPNSHTWSLT
jgi:hypothetical protein